MGLIWYVPDRQFTHITKSRPNEPTLIVCNHPNSFFDALVLVAYHPGEMCFLTRGDLFRRPFLNWLLRALNMVPIYKRSDIDEADIRNAFTYDECVRHLKEGRQILIFPEGVSRNHKGLRPLMPRGTRALIDRAVDFDIPLQIQPYVIGYSSFDYVPKGIYLERLEKIDCTDFLENGTVRTHTILQTLKARMEGAIPQESITPSTRATETKSWTKRFAKAGEFTHRWLYQLLRNTIGKKTEGTIFYDSVMFTALIFIYPMLVTLLSILIWILVGFWYAVIVFTILPFLAYCWINSREIKIQHDDLPDRLNHFQPENQLEKKGG